MIPIKRYTPSFNFLEIPYSEMTNLLRNMRYFQEYYVSGSELHSHELRGIHEI